jgi:hypothetical protein
MSEKFTQRTHTVIMLAQKEARSFSMEGMGDRATFTPRSKRVLEAAMQESLRQGHDYIRTDHLLLGLLGERGALPPVSS